MPERPQPAERDERASPAEIVAVLWRRRLWIALGILAGLLVAVAFLVLVTPRYMAVAQLLIDPNDANAIGDGLVRLFGDAGLRQRLAAAGRERLASFSWERSAAATAEVLRAAAGRSGGAR